MPYTLKTNQISVKDPETGEYRGVDILAEQTEEGLIAELQAEGTKQVNRITKAVTDVQAAVDKAESDAAKLISDTQTSIDTLETQKNTIAETVASMAELGTDTTLSTPGMAADAKKTGDEISNLSRQISDVIGVDEWYDADLWLEGHLNSATGAISTSITYNRMCTPNLIPANVTCIKVQEGYQIVPYCWSADGSTYLGIWNGTAPQKIWDENVWMVGTVDLKAISAEYRFKILAQLATGSRQLTPEADADKFIFTSFSDETLSIGGKAADAKVTGTRLSELESSMTGKASAIVNTVSGAIASFSDGADSMPIKKLVAQIEPVQDLHGYDSPWPEGGGKNKAEGFGAETKDGITCTINSAGEIVFSGTVTSQVAFNGRTFTTEAGNYYLNGCPDGGNMETTYDLYIWDMTSNRRPYKWNGTTPSGSVINSAANAEVKIESGHEYRLVIRFRNGYVANNVVFKPMLRLATEADATYEPYSNICPISGWTGLSGKRTGKNLLPNNLVNGTIDGVLYTKNSDDSISVSGTATNVSIKVISTIKLPAGTYTVNGGVTSASISVRKGSASGAQLAASSGSDVTFTLSEATTLAVVIRVANGITVSETVYPMIRLASESDSTFEPYTGQNISVNWQDTAGTAYGGSDELISGHLTVELAIVDMGNLTWTLVEGTVNRFKATPTPQIQLANNRALEIKCSCYKSNVGGGAYDLYSIYNVNQDIYVVDDNYSTVADFATAVAGQSVVYPLATPQTYQLTPQEVTTLLGNNVIWTDVGPVSVTAPRDTKMFIEKLTQPTEDDMTADHAISAGTFFQLGNTLYLATAQIAAGGTITPGTNATKLSLADALNQLNT